MEPVPGRSGVRGLALRVFGASVHPDWFAVKGHRRVARDGWQADIRIIDGGHAIAWSCGEARVTEVLAASGLPLPESGLLLHAPARRERAERLRPGRGVEYQACLEVERIDPEVFAHLCDEMALDADRDRLFHSAPGPGRMDPPAISHLAFESRARGLLVHAFHSFPGDRAIVRTQSLFETPVALPAPR